MSETTNGTIAAYFEDHSDAVRAVDALQEAGFSSAHLGVAYREGANTSKAHEAGATAGRATHAAGEKTEGVWNKVKNFFEGGDVEPYADEKNRGDLASREISTSGNVSSGRNASGAGSEYGTGERDQYGTSDFESSMNGLSVPEEHSRYFAHKFGNSDKGAVVTVNAGGREADAKSILQQHGGDLGDQAANYDYSTGRGEQNLEGSQNIQLLGEVLRVHKERVNTGDVRFRKEVITEMQTVQVPVTREELVIERHAVSDGQTAKGSIGDSGEIRIPLTEERASLDKSTVVREEVSVGKRTTENVSELSGDIRREELVVEDETKKNRDRVA